VRAVASASQTPLTVLHLSGSFAFYGAEQVIVSLARHADRSHWHPIIGCLLDPRAPQSQMLQAARALGIETIVFQLRSRCDPAGIQQVRSFLIERRAAVLHCHGYKPDFYGLLAARRLPVARISTAHGWSGETLPVRLYEGMDKWVFLRRYHRIIAVSGPIRAQLARRGHRRENIVVIPNGLDLSRFPLRPARSAGPIPVPPDAEIIGCVGRLSPEKGHSDLLLAAKSVLRERPRATFVLVGEGVQEPALRSQAAALGIADRVVFAGFRSDVAQVLAQADVFVLPSLAEGLPMALLEAMAVGVPVVATAVGDVPKVLRHGDTGLLVPPGEANKLAAAILNTLSHPQEAVSRVQSARALVEREYSASTMAARTEKLYLEALQAL
jgi:glycosyltransferase involved in cell wall biosynthesis